MVESRWQVLAAGPGTQLHTHHRGQKTPGKGPADTPPAVGKDEVPGPNPGSSSKEQFLISVLLADIRNLFYVCWF